MSGSTFSRYLVSGAVAAAANLAARTLFSLWVPFELAVVLAYGVGMCTAFVLMRRFAFGPGQRGLAAQVSGFVAVNALALLQTLVVSSLLLRHQTCLGGPLVGVGRTNTTAIAIEQGHRQGDACCHGVIAGFLEAPQAHRGTDVGQSSTLLDGDQAAGRFEFGLRDLN